LKQFGWYALQIAVFGATALMFTADDAPQIGFLAVFIIAGGFAVIATALVFWTGRLLFWAVGKTHKADDRRADSRAIIGTSEPGKLPPRRWIGKEPG
jgi:hypothetical protein